MTSELLPNKNAEKRAFSLDPAEAAKSLVGAFEGLKGEDS
jgi:hypothetical protein